MRMKTWWGGATVLMLGALGLAALGAGSIVAYEYSNSDHFCTNACHAVHPEEPIAHQGAAHARVNCVECHIGRLPTLKAMMAKTEHFHELWGMIVGYERPTISTTLKPSRQACETCHWPAATHSDTLLIKKRYDTDARSTETTIRLTLHTGFDVLRQSEAQGIHWHVENPVEYVATDIRNQEIPWVRVTYADGSQDTWTDPTATAAVDPADARLMDCLDCHNTVGHPFPNPEDKVDSAIAHGRMDRRELPSLKARSAELVEKAVALGEEGAATDDAMAALVAEVGADYLADDREPAAVAAFEKTMTDILQKSTFDAAGVTWRSFPDNSAHKDFAGCFRCHDGKHLNDEGQSIPLQCNICHDIPAVKREGGPEPVTSTKIPGVKQPPSHTKPNFMHEHRFQLDATCSACHGELEFGRDGGSFCSNPACHGREWPEVNLNVSRDG